MLAAAAAADSPPAGEEAAAAAAAAAAAGGAIAAPVRAKDGMLIAQQAMQIAVMTCACAQVRRGQGTGKAQVRCRYDTIRA